MLDFIAFLTIIALPFLLLLILLLSVGLVFTLVSIVALNASIEITS